MNKLGDDALAIVPMDGYHYRNQRLAELGRSERKGAPDTFDILNFLSMLKEIRANLNHEVTFPIFDRSIEEPIEAGGSVKPHIKLIIVEGNYLLHDKDGWELVSEHLDEVWMIDVDEELRINRLIQRHIYFGKEPEAARLWATGTDQRNAELIEMGRARADFVVKLG